MLRPITCDDQGTERTISCKHARIWPPKWARLGSAHDLRGHFTAEEFERARTWEIVCGLQAMEPAKCLQCPHALNADGTPVVPVLTLPAGASQRRLRGTKR